MKKLHMLASASATGVVIAGLVVSQVAACQPQGAVEGIAAAQHDDLVFQAGSVWQLPDFLRIGPSDTGCHRG